ncbi:MAG: hydroxyisourate hydrolase [Pseudolabrys sp.]|nr:hydroxyisourate hydrolase [Pseudolabrys sp.]MDP2295327.1 hydroxyisourate hydrolase [Pseudolabrys sp.]
MTAVGLSMPRLTTHVLDTTSGKPAAGVRVVLRRADEREIVAEALTNADGRLDHPLLAGGDFRAGEYELTFHIGDYFRAQKQATAEPPFLDTVPVRFGLAGGRDYHVPLLIQPYGYSTYRGS